MKNVKLFALLVSMLIMGSSMAMAQPKKKEPMQRPANSEEQIQKQTDRMVKHLDMTDAQKADLLEINRNFSIQQKEIREDKKEEQQSVRKDREESIEKLLTKEQLEKYLEMRDKQNDRRGDRGSRGEHPQGNRDARAPQPLP